MRSWLSDFLDSLDLKEDNLHRYNNGEGGIEMITQDYGTLSWGSTVKGRQVVITATIELIDGRKAQDILNQPYGQQRNLNKATIERLAQAMFANEFMDAICNPIFISNTGKLLDGQHRLTALTHTNQTIPFLVVRGLPEETFVYFDQNRPRAAKDALKVRGVRNATKVASAAKLIYELMEGKVSVPRNEVLNRMVQDYPAIEYAVAKAESMTAKTHIAVSVGATLYFVYSLEYPNIASRFFEKLQYGGEDMKNSKHPVARLSKKLTDEWKRSGGKGGVFWVAKGTNAGKAVYDSRWLAMCHIHQAFMAYVTGKHAFSWENDQLSIIESIEQLCRKHINIRHSYEDLDRLGIAENDSMFVEEIE